MPRNPRSLTLHDRYHSIQAGLATKTSELVAQHLRRTDTSQLATSYSGASAHAARAIDAGRIQSRALAAGYFRSLGSLELDRAPNTAPSIVETLPAEDLLAPGRIDMFQALKNGKTAEEALAIGIAQAVRAAHSQVMDVARAELANQLEGSDSVRGWRWRSRGTCAACLSQDDGAVRGKGTQFQVHPSCQCVQEPVFKVKETVKAQTGHDRFEALSTMAQNEVLGEVKAKLFRDGVVKWDDLVKVDSIGVTEAPLKEVATAAQIAAVTAELRRDDEAKTERG